MWVSSAFKFCFLLQCQLGCTLFAFLQKLVNLLSFDLFVSVENWHRDLNLNRLATSLFFDSFMGDCLPRLSPFFQSILPLLHSVVVRYHVLTLIDKVVSAEFLDVLVVSAWDSK